MASTRSRAGTLVVVLTVVIAAPASGELTAGAETPVRYFDHPGYGTAGGANEFRLEGTRWSSNELTYGFTNRTADLPAEAVDRALRNAFDAYSAVTPLTFNEVPDCGRPIGDPACQVPQIRILFAAGAHGHEEPFDGPNGVLAHAAPPGPDEGGDMHFDEDEAWTEDDLRTVVTHELGHALGLDHTGPENCPDSGGTLALMCPVYIDQQGLTQDDIAGIQAIYGRPVPKVPFAVAVTGKGGVTALEGVVSCPPACSALVPVGSTLTLSATPAGGRWRFKRWGGSCATSGRSATCTLTVDSAESVSATFAKKRRKR